MTARSFPFTPADQAQVDAIDALFDAAETQARAAIGRRIEVLGRLAEVGLQIAIALERQVNSEPSPEPAIPAIPAPPAPPPVASDVSLAYARVSRAVRLTFALQSKAIDDLMEALNQGGKYVQDQAEARHGREDPVHIRKARVGRIVERVVKAEYESESDEVFEDALNHLVVEAGELLDDEDLYGDLLARPISDIVQRICRDLNLSPDWSRLAEEVWAKDEIDSGQPGAPLAAEWVRTSAANGPAPPPDDPDGLWLQAASAAAAPPHSGSPQSGSP